MKRLSLILIVTLVISSCNLQKQASNTTGRTDDVYFTVNDTRKKAEVVYAPPVTRTESSLQDNQNASNAPVGGYTGTYANRLRFFGSVNTYYYDAYRPSIVPSLYPNYYSGWSVGLTFINPRYGYISGFNSPFSPYFGLNMPYYDPFYAHNFGGGWMNYYPQYYFNPYFYNPCFYGYGANPYYYPYFNPGYSNFYNNNSSSTPRQNAPSARRTGTSNNVPSSTNSSTSAPQNSYQNNNSNNNQNSWYNNGNSDRGGSSGSSGSSGRSGSSGSSGGNSDRGSSGSGGSTRRR
ncbi:MAG: hypothetical protein JNM67_08325 [Bacteroidetes bacterium]|nr:hypothetical protein [Bacteroidota bacterium]